MTGMKNLAGKGAVVTGSTSGIGLAMARALAAQGANVMLNGFGDAAEIEAIRKDVEDRHGVRCAYDGADLSRGEEAAALITRAEAALGAVDILVNNAGIQHVANIEDFDPARWDAVIAINLSAVFHTMRAAIPAMRARGWGRIINVASVHGKVASTGKSAYVAAKHGVMGLTKVGALELAETGVTVNAICPGWVRTPLVEKQIEALAAREGLSIEDAAVELLSEKQPAKRFVTPEQLGEAAVFLCSEAAGTMTGSDLTLDGGWSAQ